MKSPAILELERLAMAANRFKYPLLPNGARYIGKFTDKTANNLTKCVIEFLHLNGWQAERINCTGRMLDNTKVVDNVVYQHRIGSKHWIPTSGQRGTADISATIAGRSVKIEIKVNKDKQRPAQIEYQKQVEKSGGLYLIIKTFQQFYDWYQKETSFGEEVNEIKGVNQKTRT